MKPLEKMSFSQNAQQIISYVFYILFAGFSIYKIIQVEFLSTKILFIILLVIILAVALYSEYLKHLYRKAIKTIAYDLNPERANEQFNELLKKELSNSLKYKYLSMFILYEDFISMLLKEYNIYKIGITIDSAIKLLKDIDITYRHDVESIIYAFANKFLSGKDLERVKEELRVTEIGKSLIEEGKEEGIKAGEKKKAIEIAKGLLDILSIEIIAQKTGLTVDEVKALKDEVK